MMYFLNLMKMGLGTELFLAKVGVGDSDCEALKDEERLEICRPYNWDNLSEKEQNEILLKESQLVSLADAEKSLEEDPSIRVANWIVARDLVFSVLNTSGQPELSTDGRALRKQEVDEVRHQNLMESDPVYREKVEFEIAHNKMLCDALSQAHSRTGL